MTSREPLTAGVSASGAAVAMVASANPFVQQLIGQADSLSAVSRSVESQMKREGIPVLAATRDFLDFAQRGLGTVAPPPRNGGYRQPEPPPMPEPIVRPEPRFDDWSNPVLPPKSFIDDPMPPRSGAPFIDPPIQRGNTTPFLDDPILRNHISPFLQRRDDVSPFIDSGPRDLPRRPSSTPRDYDDVLPSPFVDPPASRGFDMDDLVDAPEVLDDAPVASSAAPLSEPPAPFNLDVSPFPSLSHDEEETEVVDIVSFAEPLVMPEAVVDTTMADWTDHKNFHSNDHARAYDIDLTPDEHVVAPRPFAARVEPAVVEATVAVAETDEVVIQTAANVVEAEQDEFDVNKTLIDYGAPPPLAATIEISATAAKTANLSHTLGRIADHYRHRAQVSASKSAERVLDAALEPDIVMPVQAVKPGAIPGQIAHPYMVTVHNNLEIPKVPPYIWQAPEEIYDRDDAGMDPLLSWKNCSGNRHQLSFDI